MKILDVKLTISAVRKSQFPEDRKGEFLLVGRSNVGKSSFINTIINRKNFARTSSNPGKTQTINFYLVNNEFYLVDAPGYGFANLSKERQKKFGLMMEDYLTNRKDLKNVFMLVDFRHTPTEDDLLMYNFLKYYNIPVTIVATKVAVQGTYRYSLPQTTRKLNDAPYKMFCLPYAENIDLLVNNERIKLDYNKCLQIASSLATGLKTGAEGLLYDIQLLPYCPIKEYFVNYEVAQDRTLSYLYGGVENVDYTLIKDNETTIGAIFWCPMSSFTTISKDEVWYNRNWSKLDINDPISFKTNNETVMTRMVSPNYANNDSFNQFMNYGVNYIDIDCTYKPYTPYIKCNINYKGLYGKDFDDNRGLVLGGDFTLPAVNDKWIDYQIQNKNYANIFERETQNLEYKHKCVFSSLFSLHKFVLAK